MKVAVDVIPVRPGGEMGGAHHLVLELLKGLIRRHPDTEYVLLTAVWNHSYFQAFENNRVHRICLNHDLSNRDTLKQILSNSKIDLLFCPMGAITVSAPGVPVISVINDIQHEYYPQFFDVQELNHRKKFYQNIKEQADAIICISNYTKETFVHKYHFPSEKSYVIPISIQSRITPPSSEQENHVLHNYSIDKRDYVFYPANFWPHKNHRMLLTAFSIICHRFPDILLDLVMTGRLWEKDTVIQDAIKQMGLEDRVHFLGYVPDQELAALISGAKLIVFPSLYEGFGIPVAEAMAFGKPVLCSHTTSLPEVGGEAAKYLDPRMPLSIADEIVNIVKDETLQHQMVQAGYQQIKKFDFNQMVDAYYEVFRKVFKYGKKPHQIEGVYPDSWSGSTVLIHLGKSGKKRNVQLDCAVPFFHPFGIVKMNALVNGQDAGTIYLSRNESKKVSLMISHEESKIEIQITPTFKPADYGGRDTRNLGIQITNVKVKSIISGG